VALTTTIATLRVDAAAEPQPFGPGPTSASA
jgi:hypothetical protein